MRAGAYSNFCALNSFFVFIVECWFIVNIKPKKESLVERLFQQKGILSYYPKYLKNGRPAPFFPGYGFVYFDYPAQFNLIKYTRGVRTVVGHSHCPIPVCSTLIVEIKARECDGYIQLSEECGEACVGDEIEITTGPLKGVRGIFSEKLKDRDRVAILLQYVSYQGKVLIEKCKLKKVGGGGSHGPTE